MFIKKKYFFFLLLYHSLIPTVFLWLFAEAPSYKYNILALLQICLHVFLAIFERSLAVYFIYRIIESCMI